MSIDLISAVFKRGPRDKSLLLVMVALADNANDAGVCWPRLSTIAHKSRISERTAMRLLSSLQSEGWLTIEKRAVANYDQKRKRNRPGQINRYQLNLHRLGVSGDTVSPDIFSPDTISPDTVACESPVKNPKKRRKNLCKTRGKPKISASAVT